MAFGRSLAEFRSGFYFTFHSIMCVYFQFSLDFFFCQPGVTTLALKVTKQRGNRTPQVLQAAVVTTCSTEKQSISCCIADDSQSIILLKGQTITAPCA